MSEPQMYAPDYLRAHPDKQLHLIADMIEKQINTLQTERAKVAELQAEVERLNADNIVRLADAHQYSKERDAYRELCGRMYEAFAQVKYAYDQDDSVAMAHVMMDLREVSMEFESMK